MNDELTFITLGLQHLTGGLMFKLIILAQERVTKRTTEDSASMLVNTTFTFTASCILQTQKMNYIYRIRCNHF